MPAHFTSIIAFVGFTFTGRRSLSGAAPGSIEGRKRITQRTLLIEGTKDSEGILG